MKETNGVLHGQIHSFVYGDKKSMGQAAAEMTGKIIGGLLQKEPYINMVFAAAPSQNEFLDALVELSGIEWERIRGFHLDEYIGLPEEAPQRFAMYLHNHIFSRVPFKEIHYIETNSNTNPELLCIHYSELLEQHKIHIACIGIGETGHIAFNDPSAADFHDPRRIKIVKLEEKSRQQQVNDNCFASLKEVPTHAITLTIPTIMSARNIICVVPGKRKSEAVKQTLEGPISTECPASILRRHANAAVFLDKESASLLLTR